MTQKYQCPDCLYVVVMRGASRCPKCHTPVTPEFWVQANENERLALERLEAEERHRAEEWERGRPGRERAVAEAEARATEAQARALRKEKAFAVDQFWGSVFLLYFLYLLPIFVLFAAIGDDSLSKGFKFPSTSYVAFWPIVNWIFVVVTLFSPLRNLVIGLLALGSVVGFVFVLVASRMTDPSKS